jgi:hypothetical protein
MVRDAAGVDHSALATLALRGIARPAPSSLHFIVGPDSAAAYQELRRLIDQAG